MITFLLQKGGNIHDDVCLKAAIFSNEINVIYKLVDAGYNNWMYAFEISIAYSHAAVFMFFLTKYHPTPDEVAELGELIRINPNPDIEHVLIADYGLVYPL